MRGRPDWKAGLVSRKTGLCVVICTAAALMSGCVSEGEVLPTAAEVEPVIHERGAVARQYWASAQAFERAPLGFKVRLEEARRRLYSLQPGRWH